MIKYAIIVTYEPDRKHLKTLTQCVESAEFIPIVVDNSEKNQVTSEDVSEKSIIINLQGNYGIAAAQNRGIETALKNDADVIGFFDQDSNADEELIRKLAEFIEQNGGCVAAPLALDKDTLDEYPAQKINSIGYPSDTFVKGSTNPQLVDLVISSGMMTSSDVIRKTGAYDEDFFIDFVDIEWCLRCKKKGVPIYVLPDAVLLHKIGNESIEAEGMEITVHSPIRTYYKVRNSFLLLYKKIGIIFSIRQILPALIHNLLILFKVKNKKEYAKYYFTGIIHGICGVRGKYKKGK